MITPIGDPMVVGYGLASGPANERAVVIACDDDVSPSNCGTDSSDVHSILMTSDGTPSRSAEAELTSFDPSGFTLNWTLNEARADIIHGNYILVYTILSRRDLPLSFPLC